MKTRIFDLLLYKGRGSRKSRSRGSNITLPFSDVANLHFPAFQKQFKRDRNHLST